MVPDIKEARVAIVHDWLVTYAGAERVLEQMLYCFPQADLFSLVDFVPEADRGFILNKPVTTSFVQKLPFARRKYRVYLPFMPLAVEQFDVSAYDLVISSSHAVAKGVLTGPNQTHVCMCYSPIRYAWDLQHQYLRESGLSIGIRGFVAKRILHQMRLWDNRTANGVDNFIAISNFIARRIWKTYRRESTVIYPPVDVASFTLHDEKEDYYLTASRMVPYKRICLIADAFSRMPGKKLVVIGDGPELAKVRSKAGTNVKVLGYQSSDVLRHHMQRAKAFVFAAEEDFGIAPVEAQACGTPVIAYGKGGSLETIIESETGIFFYDQSADALINAVKNFEAHNNTFSPQRIRANAERFSTERFRREFIAFISETQRNSKRAQAEARVASASIPPP